MQQLVTAKEMKMCDYNTINHFGIPSLVLMERAALAVAARIDEWKKDNEIYRSCNTLVVCGRGNNGGDGVAIARILSQHGYLVQIALVGDGEKSKELNTQLKSAMAYNIPISSFEEVISSRSQMEWDVIVDAMLGIGCSRNVEGEYAKAIIYMDECKKLKDKSLLLAAVDIPSGINADTGKVCAIAVKADMTVTFNFAKVGHILYPGTEYVGNLFVEDIGITQESFLDEQSRFFFFDEKIEELIPKRISFGNKGTFGKILIIAGCKSVSGACILSCTSALRSGCGMAKIFSTKENVEAIKVLVPEAMYDVYEDTFEKENIEKVYIALKNILSWCDVVVIGPGLSTEDMQHHILTKVLEIFDKDIVIDADAINMIAEDDNLKDLAKNYKNRCGGNLVMTPHIAEFSRIYNATFKENCTNLYIKENILTLPKKIADYYNCIVVCKDARSVVSGSDNQRSYVNISGNSGMSTAGSGDVLCGIIASILARNIGAFQAACIGTYVHGIAGNLAAMEVGEYYMKAGDIIEELKKVLPRE